MTADAAVLVFDAVTFGYRGVELPVLSRVNLSFAAGAIALICGPTGSGKSTLLRCANGLAPHFTGGVLGGQILIDGEDVTGSKPSDLAVRIGYVNQQPDRGLVGQTVTDEIVFGMEQLGISREAMRRRLEEFAKRLSLEGLLGRETSSLSGGEQQRVAIAAALAAGQRILLLDEPTSALDGDATHATMQLLRELADEEGIAILLVEHRIERVLDWVDSITVISNDGTAAQASRAAAGRELWRDYRLLPPFMELAKIAGWTEVPLSITDAQESWNARPAAWNSLSVRADSDVIFEANGLVVEHRVARKQSIRAIDGIDIRLNSGEVLGILGSNGAGKSSLLWKLQSLTHAVMVPQQASDLLFLPSVGDEFRESDRYAGVELGTTANLFVQLVGRVDTAMHPRDLSAGRQLALALAVQLVKDSRVILLDEPTRGLDYAAKRALVELLRNLQHEGRAIVVASHDIEFLAAICDRVLTLRAGRVEALRSAEQQFGFGGATEGELAQVSCRPGLIRLSQVEPGPATTVRREASNA